MDISIFKNMTSKMPSTGSLEGIVAFMKSDEKLKLFTESYRQTGTKSFKQEAPLFAVACRFEGGKGKDNVKELTKLSLVDFDEITGEEPVGIANPLAQQQILDLKKLVSRLTGAIII